MNPFICVLCVLGLASVDTSDRNMSLLGQRPIAFQGIAVTGNVRPDLPELSDFYKSRRQVAAYQNATGGQCPALATRGAKHRAKHQNNRQVQVYQDTNLVSPNERGQCAAHIGQCPVGNSSGKKRR